MQYSHVTSTSPLLLTSTSNPTDSYYRDSPKSPNFKSQVVHTSLLKKTSRKHQHIQYSDCIDVNERFDAWASGQNHYIPAPQMPLTGRRPKKDSRKLSADNKTLLESTTYFYYMLDTLVDTVPDAPHITFAMSSESVPIMFWSFWRETFSCSAMEIQYLWLNPQAPSHAVGCFVPLSSLG
jgi:hypothetical protein